MDSLRVAPAQITIPVYHMCHHKPTPYETPYDLPYMDYHILKKFLLHQFNRGKMYGK